MNLSMLVEKLKKIKEKGEIKTLRKGPTGVGHTLEQLLGLKENNLKLPDLGNYELKAIRKNTTNPITLFTKEPVFFGRSAAKYLVEEFGYETLREGSIKELYVTVSYQKPNKQGFKFEIDKKDNTLFLDNVNKKIPKIYWTYDQLKDAADNKLKSLILVLADSYNEGLNETFYYNEAYILEGFSFINFLEAIKNDYVKLDLRIHIKQNGSIRNHGTAFRIQQNKIMEIYDKRDRIL